jgi:hypothetical protein
MGRFYFFAWGVKMVDKTPIPFLHASWHFIILWTSCSSCSNIKTFLQAVMATEGDYEDGKKGGKEDEKC